MSFVLQAQSCTVRICLFDISNAHAVSRTTPRSSSHFFRFDPAVMSRNPSVEPPRVGNTLAELRQLRALSLDELSRLAGVSKSMLSQIERNQANPTVAVVWRLANALGVPLGTLLDGERPALPAITTVAGHATPSLRSPDGKCELRILGPIELAGQFEWYELTVQPGGGLGSEAHEPGWRGHPRGLRGGG